MRHWLSWQCVALLVAVLAFPPATHAQTKERPMIAGHAAHLDAAGHLLPWISWTTALEREMLFYQQCVESETNGTLSQRVRYRTLRGVRVQRVSAIRGHAGARESPAPRFSRAPYPVEMMVVRLGPFGPPGAKCAPGGLPASWLATCRPRRVRWRRGPTD